VSGICEMSAPASGGISGMVPVVSVTEAVWSPGGIRGRTGEALSSRGQRGGEEVEAFDAIDSKLPLASRSTVPKSIVGNVFENVEIESRVSDEWEMWEGSSQLVLLHRRVKNSAQDGLFRHTTNRNTTCKLSRFSYKPTRLTELQLGNYLGALANWVKLQNEASPEDQLLYSIVGWHALTLPQDPKALRAARWEMLASLLAIGLDPERSIIFHQDHVGCQILYPRPFPIVSTRTRIMRNSPGFSIVYVQSGNSRE